MADAHSNFGYTTVATAPSPASSGTSLVVTDGSVFPTVPFNAVVWPAASQPLSSNAEIVRVTARSTNTLTITRAQEGSSARSIVAGDQIMAGVTKKTLTDAEMAWGAVTVVTDAKYGAVGDGTTDDTTAIQAAIDAAGSNGNVFFPPGLVYKITADLDISAYNNIRLFSLAAGRANPSGGGGGATIRTTTGSLKMIKAEASSLNHYGPTIENLRLERGAASGTCISIAKYNNWTVRGVTCRGLGSAGSDTGTGLLVTGTGADASYGHVEGCAFQRNLKGMSMVGSSGCTIDGGCYFESNVTSHILLDLQSGAAHINVHGNKFEDVANATSGVGISVGDGCYAVDIVGNAWEGNKTMIDLVAHSGGTQYSGVQIVGNTFTGHDATELVIVVGANRQRDAAIGNRFSNTSVRFTDNGVDAIFIGNRSDVSGTGTELGEFMRIGGVYFGEGTAAAPSITVPDGSVYHRKDVGTYDRIGSAWVLRPTISTFVAGALDETTVGAFLTALGLDADLATLSVPASTTISAFIKDLLDDADAATALATLGAQPLDTDLTTLAGLTATTDNFIVSVSSAWASRTPAQVMATLSGQAGAAFSFNSQRLTSVADPTSAQDAATRAYIDSRKTIDNAAYTVGTTDATIYRTYSYFSSHVSTLLTANRIITLCAANAVPAGFRIRIEDGTGCVVPVSGATAAIEIQIKATGSDTVEGIAAATNFEVIRDKRGSVVLESDGTSDWKIIEVKPHTRHEFFTATIASGWRKSLNASSVRMRCIGGGGAGGSGHKQIQSSAAGGGGGGAGGGVTEITLKASQMPATASVTVGLGGTAGGLRSTTGTGANGNAGNESLISDGGVTYARAAGGLGGSGGGATGGIGGALNRGSSHAEWTPAGRAIAATPFGSIEGVSGKALGGGEGYDGTNAITSYLGTDGMYGGPGSGGGGGGTTGAASTGGNSGGAGSEGMGVNGIAIAPGAGASSAAVTAGDGTTSVSVYGTGAALGGAGGGGAGGRTSLGNGATGGAGGLYGGGGGGGANGVGTSGTNSNGNGGAGADGCVEIITFR